MGNEVNNIKVGKFTLESLTTGMYSDNKIIFREYIQNSVDSLDDAVKDGILSTSERYIHVIVDKDNKKITILDNGVGLSSKVAVSTLTDIGSSPKRNWKNRGFRGIGRLGGMSCCKKLIFTAKAKGEKRKTVLTFDCEKLKELLVPGKYEDYNLTRVLNEVTSSEVLNDNVDSHYFVVEMVDVNESSGLLDIDVDRDYISQVAPLPYNREEFSFGNKINDTLFESGHKAEEFPVFIGSSENDLKQIFKPYKNVFSVDKGKKEDSISQIKTFEIKVDDKRIAVGWYAETSWLGTISDSSISGIRIRKGNIGIGDSKTIGKSFKEERFNMWTMGEIFVFETNSLVPNARRDDFETNDFSTKFFKELETVVGKPVSKAARDASVVRNDKDIKKMDEISETIDDSQRIANEGFNSEFEKKQIIKNLENAENELSKILKKPLLETKKQELKTKTRLVKEKLSSINDFKINRLEPKTVNDYKQIISIVSDILSERFSKFVVDQIIDELFEKFNKEEEK